jgi:hypothetical protein
MSVVARVIALVRIILSLQCGEQNRQNLAREVLENGMCNLSGGVRVARIR